MVKYEKISTKHNRGFFRIVTEVFGERFESPLVYSYYVAKEKIEKASKFKIINKIGKVSIKKAVHYTEHEIYDPDIMEVEPFSFDLIIKRAQSAVESRR